MRKPAFAALCCALLCGLVSSANAISIIDYNPATIGSGASAFGQSITTPTGGPWDHITFNFYESFPNDGQAYASEGLYLLDTEYTEGGALPANLSPTTTGYIAHTSTIVADPVEGGVQWSFDPSVTLSPNTQYWLYMNSSSKKSDTDVHILYFTAPTTSSAEYTGGQQYYAHLPGYGAATSADMAFQLEGQPVIPEPSTCALLAFGLVSLVALRRRP